jgi:hypothetical protein
MVYVHTNLCLFYMKREEWVKVKTTMWDVFPDDMGLDMDLNDPVLEPITFEDDIPLEGSSSTTTYRVLQIGLDDHVEEPEV